MPRVIWKYSFESTDPIEIKWRPDSRVVAVAAQFEQDLYPTVWVEQSASPIELDTTAILAFVGTGMPYPDEWDYIGTCYVKHGHLVWHVLMTHDASA